MPLKDKRMKIEKFKVLLYLKKSGLDKFGKAPIMGRITVNNSKHSVNHVFLSPTSIINFTSKKQSYDDTRRSSRDNELLQRAQSDL